nr:MAG TPA: hypothetical protein [Caudoviricetes sp.]
MCKNHFTACHGRRPLGRANAVSLAPRFLQRPTRRVGRDPLFIWKRPRHLPQRLSRPFCRLPVLAWLENLKFRSSENAKTAL